MWTCSFLLLLYIQSILCLTCNETEFECKISGQCIDKKHRCDGVTDCHAAEDEHDCPLVCNSEETLCNDKLICVDNKLLCDGYEDCHDGSDEKFCPPGATKYHTCEPDHFSCPGDHFCQPNIFLCDGHNDCENGEDELECTDGILQDNSACPAPNYKCSDAEETCIPARHFCDGEADCLDGSDEHDCGNKTHHLDCLAEGKYACHDEFGNAEVMCLDFTQLCDGKPQCPGNEDEGEFCKSEECNNYGCEHECVGTPKGAECLCRPGYKLSQDGKSCEDINECTQYGICDQECINTEGSYACSCLSGYSLQGKSHCQLVVGSPELLITSFSEYGGEIRSFNPITKESLLVVENLTVPVGVGYHDLFHALLYTDAHHDHPVVEYFSLVEEDKEISKVTVVETGLEMPEDLVVDSISNIIYFTDSIKGTVSACSFEYNCSVIQNNLDKPRGLALHSTKKYLYVTEYGKEPKIVRMSQDGSNSVNILSKKVSPYLSTPNCIFVDETIDRIFWADADLSTNSGTISSANLDGSDVRLVVKDYHHPFGVTVFEDRVYWTDWQYYVLKSANKFTGNDIRTEITSNKWQLNGIKLHITKSVEEIEAQEDPCEDHDCSDLCLPSGDNKFTCACPEDMYPGIGGKSCQNYPYAHEMKLYISSESKILSLSPQKLGLIQMETVGFESGQVRMVSTETFGGNLVAATSNEDFVIVDTKWEKSNVIATNIKTDSISYDHFNNNIFWVDTATKSLKVMSESTKAVKTIVNCTQPKALHYVHSKHRLAYIDGANLLETDMNGNEIYLLATHLPEETRGLVYVEKDGAYYFADKHFIYRYGQNEGTYSDVARVKSAPVSLVKQNGYLYWTLEQSNELYWLDSNAEMPKVFSLTLRDLNIGNLHLSASSNLVDHSLGACSTKFCSDICMVSSQNIAYCECGDGRTIIQDNLLNTCKVKESDVSPKKIESTLYTLSNEYIGLIVCMIVGLVLTIVLMCGCCFIKKKTAPLEFLNRSFGRSSNQSVQEMSPVAHYKNGTLNEIYNPGYYSVSLASCPPLATSQSNAPGSVPGLSVSFQAEQEKKGIIPSIIRSIRKIRDPKMSTLDLGANVSTSYESLSSVKSSSTPNSRKRKMETIEEIDSACSMHSGGENSMEDDDFYVSSDTVQLVSKY